MTVVLMSVNSGPMINAGIFVLLLLQLHRDYFTMNSGYPAIYLYYSGYLVIYLYYSGYLTCW